MLFLLFYICPVECLKEDWCFRLFLLFYICCLDLFCNFDITLSSSGALVLLKLGHASLSYSILKNGAERGVIRRCKKRNAKMDCCKEKYWNSNTTCIFLSFIYFSTARTTYDSYWTNGLYSNLVPILYCNFFLYMWCATKL